MQRFSSTGPATSPATVGEAENVSKSFGETRALVDVSLTVQPGECHALVGRNGAGKSTLVTLFTGLNRPDRGAIRLAGEAAPSLADRGAWLARVACVYQRSMVVPPLTVAENVFLNRPVQGEGAVINWRRMRAEAHELMLEWGFDIDVDQEAATLTVEQRQIVEIARALSIGARFLILDEPTAALEKAAVDRLFERVRRLREGGVGVLYISHHLEEIYEICQRGSVHATLRRGVGYVPQDRHARGFSPQLGVDENLTHAVLDRIADRFGFVSARRRTRIAQEEAQVLQIVARSLDQPVSSLSGGNQQKVVVGRALASKPSVLVAVNPTVGVDVASKEALLDALGRAREEGVAVLLVSDDFEDLRVCTRLIVMVRGRITAQFDRGPWDRQKLISAVEGLEVAV